MTESSDQSNSHQGTSRKQKNSIKNIIHNFFKPGIETQLHIRNMVLTDIPTQTTPVFIHIRQGRERTDTQAVKINDNTATWQDIVVIDSRVPSIDSQQQQQCQQNNNSNNNNTNNNATSQQINSSSQRPSAMSNNHDYDNYDNYDNYEYEQPDENDNTTSANNKEQPTPDSTTTSSSKSQERKELRKEKKERRELERRERKEKKEKEKREKKENRENERKEKRERKLQNSNNSSFCLEFTFRLEDVSGRSSTIYGKSVLDLTQITTAKDWEYRAILHECNYESRFSCLISIKTKKRKSSAMVETLPPIPISNNNSNGKNINQATILPPQAKMPSSLGPRFEKNTIYRNSIERSYTDRPIRKIPIHNSASFDGISNISNKEILLDSPENELNDNFYADDNNNNSEAVSYSSSRRTRTSSTMRTTNIDNTNHNKWSFNIPKSHSHTRNTHNHRKNEPTIKSTASTIIIPLDQNGEEDEFEEKLPFKVQKDRLERLSDQVDDIINNVFYGFSED